ncbi:MAG: hypothetical protein HS111_28505 [Kofleriaceae bacterium]|nr:hypothetical protein [Kofleriaceae bacterium]MCL4223583.1 hypothetical protein [Myxococcales bacterium]
MAQIASRSSASEVAVATIWWQRTNRQHDFTLEAGPSFCLGCHATRTGTRAAVAVGKAHRDCHGCHGDDPHAPTPAPPCGTCHADQARTAPPGHGACAQCHEPHAATLRPRATTCAGCHADRTGGVHRGVAGGCATCHRAHGPRGVASPPPCASCHPRAALPALHASAGHSTCADCHRSHGPVPSGDRASCLSCHKDQTGHEPAAARCTSCHPFGDAR